MRAKKESRADLAIHGGPPAFDQPLYVGRPNVGDRGRLLARLSEMLDRRWFTNGGPLVHEFERRIAERVGVKHCIATCNATVGLEIAIRAAGLAGEVIVPSFTFVATAHALEWQAIRPVFCDVDPRSHLIDPRAVERLITPRTTGIIGVHVWGQPCAVGELAALAERHNLKVLFDAAHAFGCSHEGRMIGNFGLAEVFSFHATKFVNSFEGGAIVTADDKLAERMRLMRNFGFVDYDTVVAVGTNGKLPEASAAMGLTSLESMDEFIATNRVNYEAYCRELSTISGLRMLTYDEREQRNYQYIVCELDPSVASIDRDRLVEVLQAENVIARRYFYPGCHRMAPYGSRPPDPSPALLNTLALCDRVFVLPTGAAVGTEEIHVVCQIIRLALA